MSEIMIITPIAIDAPRHLHGGEITIEINESDVIVLRDALTY